MAEGARLESVYTATYRGFESLPHRHLLFIREHNLGEMAEWLKAPVLKTGIR